MIKINEFNNKEIVIFIIIMIIIITVDPGKGHKRQREADGRCREGEEAAAE